MSWGVSYFSKRQSCWKNGLQLFCEITELDKISLLLYKSQAHKTITNSKNRIKIMFDLLK